MSEIESVARAICLTQFGDETVHGEARCCQVGGVDGCCVETLHPEATAAIAALDAYRAEERRKNCKHINQTGTGMVGSDGSSYHDWYCRDCHASGHSETPARPATAALLLMNGVVGSPTGERT